MSDDVQIALNGVSDFLAKIDRLETFMYSPKLRGVFEDTGQAYVQLAQDAVPKQSRLLKASIFYQVENFGTPEAQVRVGVGGNAARYASFVNFGTRPSPRYAKQRRFMHWFQNSKGQTVQMPYGLRQVPAGLQSIFAKKVNHPGTKPQPFFYQHFPIIRARFEAAIARLLQEELNAPSASQV